nr:MAG TPA: hypothetical protein [Caudoviricetes sp.]
MLVSNIIRNFASDLEINRKLKEFSFKILIVKVLHYI